MPVSIAREDRSENTPKIPQKNESNLVRNEPKEEEKKDGLTVKLEMSVGGEVYSSVERYITREVLEMRHQRQYQIEHIISKLAVTGVSKLIKAYDNEKS